MLWHSVCWPFSLTPYHFLCHSHFYLHRLPFTIFFSLFIFFMISPSNTRLYTISFLYIKYFIILFIFYNYFSLKIFQKNLRNIILNWNVYIKWLTALTYPVVFVSTLISYWSAFLTVAIRSFQYVTAGQWPIKTGVHLLVTLFFSH